MSPDAKKKLVKVLESLTDIQLLAYFTMALRSVAAYTAVMKEIGVTQVLGSSMRPGDEGVPDDNFCRGLYNHHLTIPMLCMDECIRRWGEGDWVSVGDDMTVTSAQSLVTAFGDDTHPLYPDYNNGDGGEISYQISFSLEDGDEQPYFFTIWDQVGIDSQFIEPPILELQW